AEIPIVFTPRLNCQWRWLNASALACNLNEKDALTPATKYALTINPGIKATDGATIAQAYHHVFITQRPDVKSAWIDYWESPGKPLIRLLTSQPVDQKSLAQSLEFRTTQTIIEAKVTPDLTPQDTGQDQGAADSNASDSDSTNTNA